MEEEEGEDVAQGCSAEGGSVALEAGWDCLGIISGLGVLC